MHSHSIDEFRHAHMFLGEAHERNERKVWIVIAICAAMMALEIVGGVWFGSVALIADGLHMSTHAGALLIAALSYTYARRYTQHSRLAFGTGKLGGSCSVHQCDRPSHDRAADRVRERGTPAAARTDCLQRGDPDRRAWIVRQSPYGVSVAR